MAGMPAGGPSLTNPDKSTKNQIKRQCHESAEPQRFRKVRYD